MKIVKKIKKDSLSIKTIKILKKNWKLSLFLKILELTENKTWNEMSSRKIASILNDIQKWIIFPIKIKKVKINHDTACSY